MKILNQIKILLSFVLVAIMFASCADDDIITKSEEDLFTQGGQVPAIYNIAPNFFDFSNKEEAAINYDLLVGGDAASTMEVFLSYSGVNGDLGPFSVGTFPVPSESLSLTFVEASALVGLDIEDVAALDEFILTGASDSGTPTNRSQVIIAGCPSGLDGTYACITTVTSQDAGIGWDDCNGAVWEGMLTIATFDELNGVYDMLTNPTSDPELENWTDMSMGAYYGCYSTDASPNLPGGDIKIIDQCGKLSWTGASQWGEIFSFTRVELSADGKVLTLGWVNDYGEGAFSEITNDAGWPSDLRM